MNMRKIKILLGNQWKKDVRLCCKMIENENNTQKGMRKS
jgi:hypothetical protein